MDTKTLMRADYLDIIYDKRNKNYGGYELRRHYNQRLTRAFGVIFIGMVGFVCFSFINVNHVKPIVRRGPIVCPIPYPVEKPVVLPPKPPKPVASVPAPPARTIVFTPPVITKEPIEPDKLLTENKKLTDALPGLRNVPGDTSGIAPVDTKVPGTGVADKTEPKNEAPVIWVEQMPQFIGDMDVYLSSHLNYPDAARDANISGKVLIRFVVNEDGSVSDAVVERSIGGGCDEEALRMIRSMPKWKPGKHNGKAVKVYFKLPINFVLK